MSAEPAFSRRVAPFDVERAGFVLGEGGFGLWLQRDGGAASRHGQILGAAAAGAAVPLNAWPDKPDALARTMTLALDDAGLTAADVDVVYASANATRTLDATEAAALEQLFRRIAHGRHVGEGRARRVRRVGRRVLRGGTAVRAGGMGPADCGSRDSRSCGRGAEPGVSTGRGTGADRSRQQLRQRRRAVQRGAPGRRPAVALTWGLPA